jgi:Uma2 family endonuclease
MDAVAMDSGWPAAGGPLTVADLDRTPDDGRRYELVDGLLIVSPAPAIPHQMVLLDLAIQLRSECPEGVEVLPGPGLRMSDITELIPDLVVVRRGDLVGVRLTEPPLLAVEIRSPSTALFDMNTKKAVYERFGITSYWVVVPDRDNPSLIAFEFIRDSYMEVARVSGDEPFRAERPFPVTVVPSELVARLPR